MVAGVVLFFSVFLLQGLMPQFKTQLMLFSLIGVVLVAAGGAMQLEPAVSLSLSASKLRYFHRYGQWSVRWQDIARVSQPNFYHQLQRKDIPYIALKLNDLDVMCERISPRLASRIVHEQRDIMILACHNGDITVEQTQLNFSPYKTQVGFCVTGPIAGFLHQAAALEQAYGAHLFIPHSCFEQTSEELIVLLKEYRLSIA